MRNSERKCAYCETRDENKHEEHCINNPLHGLPKNGTACVCPNGCGGMVLNTWQWCPWCRRRTNAVEVAPPNTCFEWHGPETHRMRCRRVKGHDGPHDHNSEAHYQYYEVLNNFVGFFVPIRLTPKRESREDDDERAGRV
jgi:hypothetical protein